MAHAHISTAFDKDLDAIQRQVLQMGGLVEALIEDAATVLNDRDTERAPEVVKSDKKIDAAEETIGAAVVRVLALRQPQARDLRAVISVLKIASNLERLGDYAKNMAKRTAVIAEFDPIEGTTGQIRRIARAVGEMLKDSLNAYVGQDAKLAEDVRQRDSEVDQMYNGLFRELLTHMMEDPRNITPCMHLLFIAKNLERMGDHVTSIAEQVIYLVSGELPDDDRPKADKTTRVSATPDDVA